MLKHRDGINIGWELKTNILIKTKFKSTAQMKIQKNSVALEFSIYNIMNKRN